MHPVDWGIVFLYSLASLILGVALTRKASAGIESYFVSDRNLAWWLAGTSMAATAFSSDTPLLITGIVRSKGLWGNWEIWSLSISTMFAVFFFSKLWKRAGVITEVELVELRYQGKAAAILRGFKALYWGIIYNVFVMGAWPMTGLAKVMQETTDWNKTQALFFCMGLTVIYSSLSGYWGVVLTDFFQFFIAFLGAIILAVYAVQACGGLDSITERLAATGKLDILPPMTGGSLEEQISSPFCWLLGLIFFQWWAWKNSDGGGIIVQRIASCKNERQATLATLWFNVAHYALRSWPWIITALASLVLLPDMSDHERAYPRLITLLLPTGLRGVLIASFFAAFMSTMSTHLNWGSSYFVNDFYKRFVNKGASQSHYIRVSRILPFLLAACAMIVAFFTKSIAGVFTVILNLTAAIGPVYLLRWFWWRINAASEIAAMAASIPVILIRPWFFETLDLPGSPLLMLLFMIAASALIWLPATFLTPPVPDASLKQFRERVQPPGWWQGKSESKTSWTSSLLMWICGTISLLCFTVGPLKAVLGEPLAGSLILLAGLFLGGIVALNLKKDLTRAEAGNPVRQ